MLTIPMFEVHEVPALAFVSQEDAIKRVEESHDIFVHNAINAEVPP